MITYEQVITRFEWWADAHPMIRSFTHGNLELADLDKEKNFPAVHVQALAFPIGVHTLTYRFEVYVFELHREDQGEAREIKVDLSDALQIFGDLVAEIRNGFEAFDREDFLLQYPIEPTPFIQEFNGVYTGVQGSLAIETAFLANACESPVNVGSPPSQLCPPGTVTLNGVTFGTVASGGTLAGLVQYVNGTPVGSLVGSIWTIPNPSSCDPALITTNDDSPALSVASGATQNITIRNSAATGIGTRSGAAVTIGDSAITVNSQAYSTTPATVAGNVVVVDTNDDPVDITIAGGKVIIDDLPCAPSVIGAALPLKTGQTFVAEPNDDGANQLGRDVDWFTLDFTNPWGHTYRWTGLGGGYITNPLETNPALRDWRSADGAASTEAAVVTDNIIIDWASLSRDGTKVIMWYIVPDLTFRTFADAMAQQASVSVGSYTSAWKTPNSNIGTMIFFGGRITHALGWFPMTKTTGTKSNDLSVQWLSSEQGTFSTLAKTMNFSSTNAMIGNLAKTSTRPQGLYCRIGTVAGTVIT